MNMNKKTRMPKMESEMRPEGMGMPRFGARAMRPGGMKKGGMAHADAAMDKKLIRKEIARAEKMEEKSEGKGMKKGGAVKKMMGGGNPGMPSQRLMQQQAAPRPGMGRGLAANFGTTAGPGGGRPGMMAQQNPQNLNDLNKTRSQLQGQIAGSGGRRPAGPITQQQMQQGNGGGRLPIGVGPSTPVTQQQMRTMAQEEMQRMGLFGRPGGMPPRQPGGQGIAAAFSGGGRRPAGPITQQQMQQQAGMGLMGRPGMATKKGGAVGKMAKGGGVERKGKTKGKFI